jgi:hypothetical protein
LRHKQPSRLFYALYFSIASLCIKNLVFLNLPQPPPITTAQDV